MARSRRGQVGVGAVALVEGEHRLGHPGPRPPRGGPRPGRGGGRRPRSVSSPSKPTSRSHRRPGTDRRRPPRGTAPVPSAAPSSTGRIRPRPQPARRPPPAGPGPASTSRVEQLVRAGSGRRGAGRWPDRRAPSATARRHRSTMAGPTLARVVRGGSRSPRPVTAEHGRPGGVEGSQGRLRPGLASVPGSGWSSGRSAGLTRPGLGDQPSPRSSPTGVGTAKGATSGQVLQEPAVSRDRPGSDPRTRPPPWRDPSRQRWVADRLGYRLRGPAGTSTAVGPGPGRHRLGSSLRSSTGPADRLEPAARSSRSATQGNSSPLDPWRLSPRAGAGPARRPCRPPWPAGCWPPGRGPPSGGGGRR